MPATPLKSRDDPALRDPKLATLFVVGDSTVKNHGAGEGWGDLVGRFFDESRIQVLNWAMGGRSTRSFLEEGRWARVLAQMKAGDVVIVQFGHNDQSEITMDRGTLVSNGAETETVFSDRDGSRVTVGTFGSYLGRYVADARARGASIALCTPVPRNWWFDDGRFNNVMAEHSALVRAVGAELGVPVIDLNQPLAAKYAALGRQAVSSQWYTVGDNTHTNAAGAGVNAAAVAEGVKALGTFPLRTFLKP
jgi:lysophospholipase L1-like esterase